MAQPKSSYIVKWAIAPLLLLVMLLLVVASLIILNLPWQYEHYFKMKDAKDVASNVNTFYMREGRLPNDKDIEEMQSLGFELRVGYVPEFNRLTEKDYQLSYYIRF